MSNGQYHLFNTAPLSSAREVNRLNRARLVKDLEAYLSKLARTQEPNTNATSAAARAGSPMRWPADSRARNTQGGSSKTWSTPSGDIRSFTSRELPETPEFSIPDDTRYFKVGKLAACPMCQSTNPNLWKLPAGFLIKCHACDFGTRKLKTSSEAVRHWQLSAKLSEL